MTKSASVAVAGDAGRRWAQKLRVAAWVVAGLLLVQAALAGQFVNTTPGLVSTHRFLAEALPLLALGLAVLAWLARDQVGRGVVAGSVAIVVLMVVQTGFGFIGRTTPSIAAIHIPLGVALLGLAVYVATRAAPVPGDSSSPASPRPAVGADR